MKPFNDCCSPMEQDLIMRQKMLAMLRENDDFKKCITHIVENYIKMIDTKISMQDTEIAKATLYMRENLTQTMIDFITQLSEDGKITLELGYNPDNESLSLYANVTINNFYYDDHTFVFVEGMTWKEYVASGYNVDAHYTESNGSILYDGLQIAHLRSYEPYEYATVSPNDLIKNKAIYVGV